MTIDNEKIRELLTQLIESNPIEREKQLQEIKNDSPELYEELSSLLPFTEGDNDDIDNDPLLGEVIGHFTLNKKIGSGGMGRVYLAKQEKPERDVAVKIVRRGLLSRNASKRFEIECRLLGKLHHGGIAQIYEAGTHRMRGDSISWIAMEFIEDATPLTAYAQDNCLDTKEKLLLFKNLCEAVAEAHRHGIIHRDLKPENILVDSQGIPKVIDFGVAKAIDPMGMPTALITQATDLVGTMQYMSPEQAGGESVDVTSDIYSLGVILYELLAGQRPYDLQSTTITGAIETLKKSDPAPLRTIDKTIHRDVETVVARAMMHDPRSRYRSVNELCDDIQHLLDGEPISARKESALARFLRRKRRTAAAIVFALPILAISTGTSIYFALEAQKELQHKTKLIEFAKDALATRGEIITTNPEYWRTHYDLTIEHAKNLAGDDGLLLAEMHGMIADVADTGNLSESIRMEIAQYVGLDSERGILLQIEQCSKKSKKPLEESIKKIKKLIAQVESPSKEFRAYSLIALARKEIRSHDKEVRDDARANYQTAMQIVLKRDDMFDLEYETFKRIAWADIFREESKEANLHVLDIITPELIARTELAYGKHHPNALSLQNLVGLAHEKLGNFDAAIKVLRPAARTAADSYGVGHNLTWRYLNNLAIALAMKANLSETSEPESSELKLQAASLWYECIRQSIMHDDQGCVNWYGDTFRDCLPDIAPSVEDVNTWRDSIQFNDNPNTDNFSHFNFRSVLVDAHIE